MLMLKKPTPRIAIGLGMAGVIVVVLALAAGLNRPAAIAVAPTVTPLVIQHPTESPSTPTPIVSGARSAERFVATNVKGTGTLLSAKQATLAFAVTGRVKEFKVEEGEKVKVGTVLALLDTAFLESTVAQAQAAFDLGKASFNKVRAGPNADEVTIARSNLDRAKAAVDQAQAAYDRIGGASNPFSPMSAQGLALQQATSAYQAAVAQYNLAVNRPTETELGLAAAQLAQAQAALEAAKTSLANARIVAPFDGTVVSIVPKIGESVGANAPVMTLADLSKMQALVNLDENSLTGVKVGQPVILTVDAVGGATLTGRVRRIGLLGTATTGVVSVPVTIDIDPTDTPIYPGLSATVLFQSE